MGSVYRNKVVMNQRGGSLEINNTTENESVSLSHRSGSNITLNNVVNSELATTNKQTNVVNDEYHTVGNDNSMFVAGDNIHRVGENSYTIKGTISDDQIAAMELWKETYRPLALINSRFKVARGGFSFPNGEGYAPSGTKSSNPTLKNKMISVENKFTGYSDIPIRTSELDEVAIYSTVKDRGLTKGASSKNINTTDISNSAGVKGSNSPGVVTFGAAISSSSEEGQWDIDNPSSNLANNIVTLQDTLLPIEESIGNGGDELEVIKRNSLRIVGGTFNDFPSIRIDPRGRSQPLETLVSANGTYKNHDFMPHVEEIDNSSNFPGGDEKIIVGNRYDLTSGAGGINLKTSGAMELGGSTLKIGAKKIHIDSSYGVHIGSESGVELQSLKTITFRTNRQVYIDGALGVDKNAIFRGSVYIEGETYVQHITAPLEVQQTENTIVAGKFSIEEPRKLFIAECKIGDNYYPVFALPTDNLIVSYPHSHHFHNIPLRLATANTDVRQFAQADGINNHSNICQALAQNHEHKDPQSIIF